jgi:hypothetical protein
MAGSPAACARGCPFLPQSKPPLTSYTHEQFFQCLLANKSAGSVWSLALGDAAWTQTPRDGTQPPKAAAVVQCCSRSSAAGRQLAVPALPSRLGPGLGTPGPRPKHRSHQRQGAAVCAPAQPVRAPRRPTRAVGATHSVTPPPRQPTASAPLPPGQSEVGDVGGNVEDEQVARQYHENQPERLEDAKVGEDGPWGGGGGRFVGSTSATNPVRRQQLCAPEVPPSRLCKPARLPGPPITAHQGRLRSPALGW